MSEAMINLLISALGDTLIMVFASSPCSAACSACRSAAPHVTKAGQILANPLLNKVPGVIVNVGRSVPFIILLVAIIPMTRFIVGTSMAQSSSPFIASVARARSCSLVGVDGCWKWLRYSHYSEGPRYLNSHCSFVTSVIVTQVLLRWWFGDGIGGYQRSRRHKRNTVEQPGGAGSTTRARVSARTNNVSSLIVDFRQEAIRLARSSSWYLGSRIQPEEASLFFSRAGSGEY